MNDITESLKSLVINNVDSAERLKTVDLKVKLYMDVLNFATDFFPIGFPWSVTRAYSKIKSFVAAKNSNIELKCFIDDTAPSDESKKKYRTRREREVRNGIKAIPQGLGKCIHPKFKRLQNYHLKNANFFCIIKEYY